MSEFYIVVSYLKFFFCGYFSLIVHMSDSLTATVIKQCLFFEGPNILSINL